MLSFQGQADGRAVRRALRGQAEAFEGLARRYYAVVYGAAYAQTGNRCDAEDVAQEALLRAYTKLPALKDPRVFGPWLLRIVRNTAYDLRTRRQREREAVAQLSPPQPVAPDMTARELAETVRRKIMELEAGPRELLLLRYFSGKSLRELARILEITPNAANKRLARARETLGAALLAELDRGEPREAKAQRATRAVAVVVATEPAWQSSAKAATTMPGWFVPYAVPAAAGSVALTVAGYLVLNDTPNNADAVTTPAVDSGTRQEASVTGTPTASPTNSVHLAANPAPAAEATAAPSLVDSMEPVNARIAGQLVDAYGTGQPGQVLRLRPQGREAANSTAPQDAITGDDGAFVFSGLNAGDFKIAFIAPDDPDARYIFGREFTLNESEQIDDALLVWDPELRVWGRVTNSAGEPVSGAWVQASFVNVVAPEIQGTPVADAYIAGLPPRKGELPPRAQRLPEGGIPMTTTTGKTDNDGRYELYCPPKRYANGMIVDAAGYMRGGEANIWPYGEQNFVLLRVPEVRGRVVDAINGDPITSFSVRYGAKGQNPSGNLRAAESVARGPNMQHDEGEFALHLARNDLVFFDALRGISSYFADSEIVVGYVTPATQAQDSDGMVTGAEYELSAGAEGYASTTLPLPTVQPDEVLDDFVIELQPATHIAGIVRNVKGEPVKNAHINAGNGVGNSGGLVRTDADGLFTLPQTDPPLTALSAWRIGYAPSWAPVVDNRVAFVLNGGGTLEVAIKDGLRLDGYAQSLTVDTILPGGERRSYPPGRGGEVFQIPRISTDTVAVEITVRLLDDDTENVWQILDAPDYRYTRKTPTEFVAGEITRIAFELVYDTAAGLAGSVTRGGEAAGGGEITLTTTLPNGDVFSAATRVDENGDYAIGNLPSGVYEGIVTMAQDGQVHEHDFTAAIHSDAATQRDISF